MEAARQCARDRNERLFLRGSCVPLDRPPSLCVLINLERGGMPFHDGVGINCKKGATSEVKALEPNIGLWCVWRVIVRV